MKKVLNTTVNILAWILLIFAFLVTLIVFSSGKNNGVANLFGYIPMTVESDSMKPTFVKDDLIICKEIDDINSLKENDVITFWTVINGKKAKNTHRIVSVVDEDGIRSFITRGDNNSIDDTTPVSSVDIIGKWTDKKIGGFGKVMNFLRTKKGFFICIIIPMALFFIFELYKFIVALIEVKRPEPVEQLDEEEIKRRAIEEYLASKGETPEPSAANAEKAVEKSAEETTEKTTETVTEKAEGTAEKTTETVTEKAEETPEKPTETVTEKAEEIAEKTTETVTEKAEETPEKPIETTAENNDGTVLKVSKTAGKAI
jgi:signal peptidase